MTTTQTVNLAREQLLKVAEDYRNHGYRKNGFKTPSF